MSYFDRTALRGVLDPTIAYYTTVISFTTAVLTIESRSQYNGLIKAFRVVNNDTTNNLTFIQGQATEPSKTVTPSSEVTVYGWESWIQVTPSTLSGKGYIELDIVPFQAALANPQTYSTGMV